MYGKKSYIIESYATAKPWVDFYFIKVLNFVNLAFTSLNVLILVRSVIQFNKFLDEIFSVKTN